MNGLLLTILLALAFALSFATFAHGRDKGTANQPSTGESVSKDKPRHKNGSGSTSDKPAEAKPAEQAKQEQPATDTTPALTVKQICDGDSDCEERHLKVGNQTAV